MSGTSKRSIQHICDIDDDPEKRIVAVAQISEDLYSFVTATMTCLA